MSNETRQVRLAEKAGQPTNRNFLTPSGFSFQVQRAPKVTYYGNLVTLPGVTLPTVVQNTYLKANPLPGDQLEFEDLRLRFLVDANLENYMEIQNWLRGLGFPESLEEIYDFQEQDSPYNRGQPEKSQLNLYSDGTLTVLNQLNNPKFKVYFKDLFPTSLTTLTFDATLQSEEFFTAEVSFKYTIYDIREIDCSQC